MRDEIVDLYFSKEPICAEGRVFLTERGLSIPAAIKAGVCSKNGVMYFIYARNGQPVRWKARLMSDKKKQWTSPMSDEDQKTFKMPFFSQYKAPGSNKLILVEGELDCVALSQLGASNCVSLPHGSGSVESSFKNNYDFLQQFETIYIAFDMDGPGQEAAKKALSMISPSKYRRINFPCKDANDWIMKNPDVELKDLEALMENASKVEVPYITNFLDLPRSFYDPVDLGITSGWKKLDYILGGIRRGEVTVISADTGSGKSTFCINLIKNIAQTGSGVWINSYEMHPKVVNRKLASMVLKKKMKYNEFSLEHIQEYVAWLKKHNIYINTLNDQVDMQILRNQFEMAALAYGMKYILIDHLDYIYANGKKKTSLENIDDAIRNLHTLAMEFDVGVILVAHPKQLDSVREITMSDIKGSSAIKQYADNIITITRMDRLDPNDKLRVKVRVWKNRLCGQESSFFLRYVPELDGYTENIDVL